MLSRKQILIILICFCAIGICFGLQYSFSLFFVAISKYFHKTKSTTSIIFSLTLLVYGLSSPILGYFVTKYGGRKIFRIGAILLCIGLISSFFSTTIYTLYFTLGLITASGMNCVGYIPVSIIIMRNFTSHKGLALGIATTGVGAGAAFFSFLTKYLLTHYNFKVAFLIYGISLPLIIFILSFYLPKLKPTNTSFRLNLQNIKNKIFIFLQLGTTFGAMTSQTLMLYIVSYLLNKGISFTVSTVAVALIGIFGSIGKILWGHLSDKYNPFKLYFFIYFLILTSLILVILKAKFVLIFAVLFGLGYGSFAPLFPAMIYNIFPGEKFGHTMGLVITGNGIGSCFSIWFLGFLYDKFKNFDLCFTMLILFITISTISFYIAYKLKKRGIKPLSLSKNSF